MTTLTLNFPDEKLRRLELVARARGIGVPRLFDEMSGILLAEANAEAGFRLRAERGAGQEERGLELLHKAAAIEG